MAFFGAAESRALIQDLRVEVRATHPNRTKRVEDRATARVFFATLATPDSCGPIRYRSLRKTNAKATAGPSTRFGAFHAPKLAQDDIQFLIAQDNG
jgi:hypothetical protein